MSIKISVITINYNNSVGLKRTIESVISQNYHNFEYILVDGNSNDASNQVIEEFKGHIDLIISEPDSGIYNAMNKGWKIAQGAYCIFMNSGDIFVDNFVLADVGSRIDPTADIIYGCHLWGSKFGGRWNPKKDFRLRDIFTHTPISHQATFFRKSQLIKVGGFKENYKIISDWGVLIDSMRMHAKLQKITRDICIAENPGESSIPNENIVNERYLYLKNHHMYYYLMIRYIVLPLVTLKRKFIH